MDFLELLIKISMTKYQAKPHLYEKYISQKQIVSQITTIESKIKKAKDMMEQSAELKAEVLKKYLE